MAKEDIICPYPGLRTFTEEESIFFKGRDEHIRKASALLEHRKFLMITGASGEGKSSIVYAGMVPYARGGFIKSEYTNWAVVDFRPERSPLANFSGSLENAFTDIDESVIKTNLSKGFSSLVGLYKNSPLYIDPSTEEWNEADEKGRKMLKRRASNLLIIVDQFEEFFTNSENYINGVPSDESALVVSTLLETARIAARDDLPIYIVFTMRSDFIGQCAAFRGLPEFIGYSQFFVPRLKRVDLKRVIQEPAGLSGVVIKERLVERLLYDLADGEDQLPILQHALNRIWGLAVDRDEDLDLLHYAMAGGLAKQDLAEEDRLKYSTWFERLNKQLKGSYKNPSLINVLDNHANQLFLEASKVGSKASHILETALKCLTAVDEDRAVRNRMTLQEITQVINDEEIGQEEVDSTLRIFRLEGNTFLKPYVDPETRDFDKLEDNSVLDITHESLIRNWKMLRDWAHEENRDHEVLEELITQMNHWLSNGKSSSFLLSSGALNYFDEWYSRVKPNKYWIWRYIKGTPGADMQMAEELLNNIREFIRKSINKNFVPRLFAQYGMLNVIATIGTTLLVLSAVIFTISSRTKQNSYIINKVKEEGIALLESNKVRTEEEAAFLVSLIRADPDKFFEYLEAIEDPYDELHQINLTLSEFISRDVTIQVDYPDMLLERGIEILDSLLSVDHEAENMERVMEILLQTQTKARTLKWHNDNPVYKTRFDQFSNSGYKLLQKLFSDPDYYNRTTIPTFFMGIGLSNAVESKIIGEHNLDSLLSFLSIYKNPAITRFNFYPNDSIDDPFFYFSLIKLHGLNNNIGLAKQSIDSLFQENSEVIPVQFFDGFQPPEILFSALTGGGIEGYREVMNHISGKMKVKNSSLYAQLLRFLLSSETNDLTSGSRIGGIANFTTLANVEEAHVLTFLREYEESFMGYSNDPLEKFELAQFYKYSGLLMDKYWTIHNMEVNNDWLYAQFDKSLEIYNEIKSLLPKRANYIIKYYRDSQQQNNRFFTLTDVYKYPDYLQENLGQHWTRFYSDAFFRYIFDKGLASSFYDGEDGNYILFHWIHNSNWTRSTDRWNYIYAFDNDIDAKLRVANIIDSLNIGNGQFGFNALAKLSAAYYQRWVGNEEAAIELLKTLDLSEFIEEYDGRTTYELYASYLMDLMYLVNDTIPEQFFTVTNNEFVTGGKTVLMFYGLDKMVHGVSNNDFFSHLNGSFELFNEYIKNPYQQYGATSIEYAAIEGLMKLNSYEMQRNVDRIIIESEELNLGRNFKLGAVRRKVKALSEQGDFYEAYQSTGEASINSRIILYMYMLNERFREEATVEESELWRRFDRNMRDANFVTERM